MFATCATINLASKDKAHDAFGFEQPVERGSVPSSRFERRERAAGNTLEYILSAHGIVSMATAIVVGILFMLCMRKVNRGMGSVSRIDGYWYVAIPLALPFLLLLARS